MDNISNSLTTDQVNAASEERTKRLFVGFLSSALGVDQTYTNQDNYVGNSADQFYIANPDGSYSVQGRARSNLQGTQQASGGIPPLLIVIGLFLVARALKG
jgi:hypothetical protein